VETLPFFKYNADPIKLGVIKQELTICPSCGKKRDYVYNGPFYSVEEVEGICPWCVADGSAATKFNGEFQDIMLLLSYYVLRLTVKDVLV
jgi:uncharacterized protein CbrC (UPF0167 family)